MSFSILGTGHALPARTVTNEDLSNIVDTSDEWIVQKTGISERHILTTESITELSVLAAQRALANAKVSADEIDMVIFSSICGDMHTPSSACLVSLALDIKCPAFDINAACTGFLYAMDIAAGYYARRKVKKVLVVCAEQMSRHLDWQDRATCVLFGDGASAVVLGEGDGLLSLNLKAIPSVELMNIPFTAGDSPFCARKKPKPYLYMNGQEIYKFAVSSACADMKEALAAAGVSDGEVSHVILHQANIRIINAIQGKFGIAADKYHNCIQDTGNISSATIPIVLDRANTNGLIKRGDIVVLAAFGGGLTSGAAVLKW